MINSVLEITEKSCCGCGSCFQSCPKHCITMQENERGFLLPEVDESLCVNCGLCVRSCPEIEQPKPYSVKKAYAAVARNMPMLKKSTSGGIFGVMSLAVLNQGGVVYGCAWGDNFKAEHIRITAVDDLYLIQQSKYLQSDTANTFVQVKNDLLNNIMVLYSGTACQIAGLRKFLKQEYDNLLTVEVACHGVPSPGLFRKYIDWIEKNTGKKVSDYQFRNKEKHKKGEHYKYCVTFADESKKYGFSKEDAYYGSFLEGRTLRCTCYNCKYKNNERIADIMLSDYWGIEREHKDFPAQNGASAVVLCSDAAIDLFSSIKDSLIFKDSSFEQITKHNHSLVQSSLVDENLRIKTINIDSNDLFTFLKPKFDIKVRVKNLVPEKLKYFMKTLR